MNSVLSKSLLLQALLLFVGQYVALCTTAFSQTGSFINTTGPLKIDMFGKNYAQSFFEVEDLTSKNAPSKVDDKEAKVEAKKNIPAAKKTEEEKVIVNGPSFVGNIKPGDILPPDQTPRVRINPEAPSPFIAMAVANQDGDKVTAAKYAEQWVRYQQNFFYEVRELTELIGKAMIKEKAIGDDDWQGVPQYIDYEMAKAREESSSVFRPSHEQSMARIKPDSKGEAGVYFFFTMNCSWCRFMASDVERLYIALKDDPKIKMVGLTMGPTPNEFLREYRRYTGATFPIYEGLPVAKQFNIQFTPALVVVAPNDQHAYLKTGKQSFEHMYEFVRRVQGQPFVKDSHFNDIASLKVGEFEHTTIDFGKDSDRFLRPEERELLRKAEMTAQNASIAVKPNKLSKNEVRF